MAVRFVLVAALLLAGAWLQAADYAVPGTTVILPLLDGMEGDPAFLGLSRAGEKVPRVSITVVRKLIRAKLFKEKTSSAVINGCEFDFNEMIKDQGDQKIAIIMASAKIDGQCLSITGIFEAGNAKDKETITKVIMGARFGTTLISSYLESLPISFEVLPELDLVMLIPTTVILAGKDEPLDTAKGMTINAFHQELAANEKDEVLKASCLQLADKIFAAKPDDGKLERATIGPMSGYRFSVSEGVGKPLGVVYALNKNTVTLVLFPAREASASDLALFVKQIAKMKTSLKLK